MPLGRWIVSVGITYHLAALTVDAIPSPSDARSIVPIQSARDAEGLGQHHGYVPTALTTAADWLERAVSVFFNATRVLRPATQFYARAGLRQQWDMFSNPVLGDEYLRIDYWVVRTDSPSALTAYRELVFPADREDRVRVAYDYRNKAMSNVLALLLTEPLNRGDQARAKSVTDAMLGYYTARFSRSFLSSADRVARITVWHGMAPVIPIGRNRRPDATPRRVALGQYDDGARRNSGSTVRAARGQPITRGGPCLDTGSGCGPMKKRATPDTGIGWLARWQHFWFEPVPPQVFAALRIVFGVLGCVTLLALRDIGIYWSLAGFVPSELGGWGIKQTARAGGVDGAAARLLYGASLAAFISFTVGFRSGASIALAFGASLLQASWNHRPMSAADAAIRAVLFCLIWADCGRVWSVAPGFVVTTGRVPRGRPPGLPLLRYG